MPSGTFTNYTQYNTKSRASAKFIHSFIFDFNFSQTASGQHGAVSRAQASSLCNHCGMPQPQLTPETAHPIKLSRTACRRNRRHFKISQAAAAPAEKAQKSSFNRAALVIPCQFCGYKTIKQFYTVAAAQHAAKIETSVGEK